MTTTTGRTFRSMYTTSLLRENEHLKAIIANIYASLDANGCAGDVGDREEETGEVVHRRFRRGSGGGHAGVPPPVLRSDGNDTNSTVQTYHHDPDHELSQAELLHKIAHYLHFCSVAILGIFVLQVMLKLYGMGLEFFKSKMEVFDAVIIISSFVLDLVFMEGVGVDRGEEAAALLIMFLLWRILRVINGIMVTAKKRQEFRIKLQKRARRRAEKKIEILDEDKHLKEKEITSLRELCARFGALQDDILACKPKKRSWIQRMDTSMGLTSVASLSLNLSMSMSGGMGNFPHMARSNPILNRRDEGGSGGHTPASGRSPALSGRAGDTHSNHVRPGISSASDHSPSPRVSNRFHNKAMARVEEEKSSDVSSESEMPLTSSRTHSNNFKTEAHIEPACGNHNNGAILGAGGGISSSGSSGSGIVPSPETTIVVTDHHDDLAKEPTVRFLLENEVIPSPTEDEYSDDREQQRLLLDLPSPSSSPTIHPHITSSPPSTPTSPTSPTSPSTVTESLVSPTMSNGPVTSDSLIDLDSHVSSPVDAEASTPTGMLLEVRNNRTSGSSNDKTRDPSSSSSSSSYATASF